MALQIETASERGEKTRKSGLNTEIVLPGLAKGPGATERMFFTEQLALLLDTGESLYGALTTIVRQTESATMRDIISDVANDVSEGVSFAKALSRHEQVFSATYVNLIAASEAGGFMPQVLQQLLNMDQKREQLRGTLVSAATYPAFLITFSLFVVVFVLIVIFPKFDSMFESIYDQLPATTRVLMVISDALIRHWWAILAVTLVVSVGLHTWVRSEAGRNRIDHIKTHWPGIGAIFTQVYLVQSMQVLSLSLTHGVSVMESLDACRDVVGNRAFRRLIERIEEKVQAGAGVAAGFDESDFVPDLAKHMISTGEQTGNLGKVMGRIAEYYESQLRKRLETLSKLAEPVMLLVMGIIVGVLVSSLILPIFKLSRAVA